MLRYVLIAQARAAAYQSARALVRTHPSHFAVALAAHAFTIVQAAMNQTGFTSADDAIKLLLDTVGAAGAAAAALLTHVISLLLSGLNTAIHVVALQELTAIGGKYPGEFRTVMAAMPETERVKLANSLRASATAAAPQVAAQPVAAAAPTIQLKMDFSAFGKK